MSFNKIYIKIDELDNVLKMKLSSIETNTIAYILSEEKPVYVIMDVMHYNNIMNNLYINNINNNNIELNKMLNRIGKSIFVDFYFTFKNDNNPINFLVEKGLTLNSSRNRSAYAKKVFINNLQIDALSIIIESSSVDGLTKRKAKEILIKEIENSHGDSIDDIRVINMIKQQKLKIGKTIRSLFIRLLQGNYLSNIEIKNMTELEYSKKVFKLNCPVLKIVNENKTIKEQKCDSKGYNRYYNDPIIVDDTKYLLFSQWRENRHRECFDNWIAKRLFYILKYEVDKLENESVFSVQKILNVFWDYLSCNVRDSIENEYFHYTLKQGNVIISNEKEGIKFYIKR